MRAGAAEAAVAPYAGALGRSVPEILADLESYFLLLQKWQRVQNLVSRETLAQYWSRHVEDSLQILAMFSEMDKTVLDLGSGGGLPAIPLAIASKFQSRTFILVEPNQRKGSFLRTVARELALPVRVETRRAEAIGPGELPPIDVITSRALAPLAELCGLMLPFFGPRTRAILHKGREHVDELAESGAVWHHDVVVRKSVTDERGAILELTGLRLRDK